MEHGRSAGVNSEGDWRMGSAGLHLLLVLVATAISVGARFPF